jgi:putative ABC transport system permease protein
MRAPFGLGARILIFARPRFIAATAGVAVAVVIIFVEMGMLFAVLDSQARLGTIVRADLVAINVARTNLHKWNRMDTVRLNEIAATDGVERAVPIYQGTATLRDRSDNRVHRIVVIAFPPNDLPLAIGDPATISRLLRVPDNVLYDRLSRPIFGTVTAGKDIEIDGVQVRLAGYVEIGPDVVNDGTLVMSEGTWLQHADGDTPIMAAIHLQPGADLEAVRRRILAVVPPDVVVLTPAEVRNREFAFTLKSAPIGILFGVGMMAGLVVGLVTCYQILFNEIVDRMRQYATLKAMGFGDGFLRSIVIEQGIVLSCAGFPLGAALALGANAYLERQTFLAVDFGPLSLLMVFLLTVAICVIGSLIAVRQLTHVDVAALY